MEFIKVNKNVYLSETAIEGYMVIPVSKDSKWRVRVLLKDSFIDGDLVDTEEDAYKEANRLFKSEKKEVAPKVATKKGVKNGTK